MSRTALLSHGATGIPLRNETPPPMTFRSLTPPSGGADVATRGMGQAVGSTHASGSKMKYSASRYCLFMVDSHSRETNAATPTKPYPIFPIPEGEGGISFVPWGRTENPDSDTPTSPEPAPGLWWIRGRGWVEVLHNEKPIAILEPHQDENSPTPPGEPPEPGHAWVQGWGWLPERWVGKVSPKSALASPMPLDVPPPVAGATPPADPEPEMPQMSRQHNAKPKKTRVKTKPVAEANPPAPPTPSQSEDARATYDSTHPRIPGEVGRLLRRLGAETTLEMSQTHDDPRPLGYGETFRLLLQLHAYLPEPKDDLGTRRLRAMYHVLRSKPKRLQPRGLPDWGKAE